MVSEGSCDTEDWSNDAEKSALITYILKYIQIQIFHNITYFAVFWIKEMQAWRGEETFLNSKNSKNLTVQKRLTVRVAIQYILFLILTLLFCNI